MGTVKEIKAPIEHEMKIFEAKFRASMKSNTPLLDKIMHYIVKRKGKQMRPMFVFLTAKMWGETKESTYTASSLIELLHTATLVHDDVVDDSEQRRGFFSLNALWKNKIAVLVGDYLLSKGLLLAVEKEEFELLKIVSSAVSEMSEGELLQIEKARKLNITEDIYFEIIRQKTATLIATCCKAGAASMGASEDEITRMHLFGEKVGIAFQMKDDLFDYGSGLNIGKPTGIDIKERKLTLPLIYALNNAEKKDRRWVTKYIKHYHENPQKVQQVIDYVNASGGIEYTYKKMLVIKDEALAILHSFPDCQSRQSLEQLVEYSIARKK